ncbi:MAG: FAD-dependent oxidoreductase [Hydrogeniiclostridium mannosilyticum]
MKILEGKSYDVLVCGAGCAGFCAAVQAARAGMRTALVEKYGMPGGIMTVLGNQDVAQFNAHGKMVIEGIGWAFLKELEAQGYAEIPDMSVKGLPHPLYGVRVNIGGCQADGRLFPARGNRPVLQPAGLRRSGGGNGRHPDYRVLIASKQGIRRLKGTVAVDCTGDGDVCAWAGAPYECGGESETDLQPGTLRYYLTAALRRRGLRPSLPGWSALCRRDGCCRRILQGTAWAMFWRPAATTLTIFLVLTRRTAIVRPRPRFAAAKACCVCWRPSGVPAQA